MQVLHDRSSTQWVSKRFNDRYVIQIPSFERYPKGDYEPERCHSMEENLEKGDILFDIGVSDGWMSAIYAKFVGAENICLFEPSWKVWANIKAVWDANGLKQPKSCFWGFVSDRTNLRPSSFIDNEKLEYKDNWPISAYDDILIEEMCFRSLLSSADRIPQVTLDDFVQETKIVPDALSIDVEGAEFRVLQGAENVLAHHHPLIWLSLHDINGAIDFDYHTSKDEIFGWLRDRDYSMTWLENYGDSHWLCK